MKGNVAVIRTEAKTLNRTSIETYQIAAPAECENFKLLRSPMRLSYSLPALAKPAGNKTAVAAPPLRPGLVEPGNNGDRVSERPRRGKAPEITHAVSYSFLFSFAPTRASRTVVRSRSPHEHAAGQRRAAEHGDVLERARLGR